MAGQPVREVIRAPVSAVEPDSQAKHVEAGGDVQTLLDTAIEPIAAKPDLRNRILELRAIHDHTIDEVSRDSIIDAHGTCGHSAMRSSETLSLPPETVPYRRRPAPGP